MIALFTCARRGVVPLAVITGASVTLYTGMVRAQAATSKVTAMAAASRARARRPAPLLEDLFKLLLRPFIGLPAPLNRAFNDVFGFLSNRSSGLFSALTDALADLGCFVSSPRGVLFDFFDQSSGGFALS